MNQVPIMCTQAGMTVIGNKLYLAGGPDPAMTIMHIYDAKTDGEMFG